VQALPVEAIRPPAEVLPGLGHVAGVVALADGVLLIQDLDAFLSIEEDRQLSHALQTGGA
ncbi:MAG: chemotaxis protein CheW, partial [Nitrospirales bacterium]